MSQIVALSGVVGLTVISYLATQCITSRPHARKCDCFCSGKSSNVTM